MKNPLLIFSLVCVTTFINAQNTMVIDTIYANDHKNVALFFPNPIRQGITGAENFVFTYNREKEQYFGLLQATPGTESNLLTITSDGQIYAYILKFAEQLPNLNYFIHEGKSIGNEKPKLKDKISDADSLVHKSLDNSTYYKGFSEYLLRLKYESIATKRRKGLVLKLLNLKYHKDEVYIVLELKNKSGIDFEIDYLNINRSNGNNKRKASYQRLNMEVNYKHELPQVVMNNHVKRFLYVLPKFVLGDNEKLEIVLQELKGSRHILLESK